jgi:hypothetical protein
MARLSLVRPISEPEAAVLTRVLERCAMKGRLQIDRASLSKLNVVARCDCGCDTVDFTTIDWSDPPAVIAEGQGKTKGGDDVGIIVFGSERSVACLEVYSHSPGPARLPVLDSITPYGSRESAF